MPGRVWGFVWDENDHEVFYPHPTRRVVIHLLDLEGVIEMNVNLANAEKVAANLNALKAVGIPELSGIDLDDVECAPIHAYSTDVTVLLDSHIPWDGLKGLIDEHAAAFKAAGWTPGFGMEQERTRPDSFVYCKHYHAPTVETVMIFMYYYLAEIPVTVLEGELEVVC